MPEDGTLPSLCFGLFQYGDYVCLTVLCFVSVKVFNGFLIKFLIGIVGGGVQLGPLGTAATNGLLCQPRVFMMMEKLVK
jgi:hypothetical protein